MDAVDPLAVKDHTTPTPPTPAAPSKAELVQTAQFVLNLVTEGEPQPARKQALSQVAKAHLDVLLKAAGAI